MDLDKVLNFTDRVNYNNFNKLDIFGVFLAIFFPCFID